MDILLLVGIGALLLMGALLLGRRRRGPGKRTPPGPQQASAGADPLQELSPSPCQPAGVVPGMGRAPRPLGPRQRRQMLRYLKSAYDKGSNARLAAMEDMAAWGHPACLPLLRRGLRDADLRVVGLAARGLERFRGPRHGLNHPRRRPRRSRGHRPSAPV